MKKIKVKAWAYLHKKDKTLVNFAMPVPDYEEFARRTEASKKQIKRVEDSKEYKIVQVEIVHTYGKKNKKKSI